MIILSLAATWLSIFVQKRTAADWKSPENIIDPEQKVVLIFGKYIVILPRKVLIIRGS